MKIFITGGTGFIGSTLTKELASQGHEVTILTRAIKKGHSLPEGIFLLEGDPTKRGSWQDKVAEHDAIINLAGATILSRWSDEKKGKIRDSRISTTNHLVEAIAEREGKETHLLSASAVGYYGFHGDEILDENNLAGTDFLASLAAEWETVALGAERYGARVVLCRIGFVLGKRGSVLEKMASVFKLRLGSQLGNGKQWVSWIHEWDLANIFLFLLERNDLEGPINCTAPDPVRNREMAENLGKVLGKPPFLPPVSSFFIKLMLGEFGEVVLKGQRALPDKLLKSGFVFKFPTIEEALNDILLT